MDISAGLHQSSTIFFAKKSRDTTAHTGTNELRRLITRKFKECKIYLSLKDNYWGAELTDM